MQEDQPGLPGPGGVRHGGARDRREQQEARQDQGGPGLQPQRMRRVRGCRVCSPRGLGHLSTGRAGFWSRTAWAGQHRGVRLSGRALAGPAGLLLTAWHYCEGGGLFAQQEREPIRGRPAVRGKRTYGGQLGQHVEEQGTWAAQKHSEAGYGRPVDRGAWTAKTVKRSRQQPAQPPTRQLPGAADTQTAHPATFSTAPTHQLLGSGNAETTPAGAPAAAADRTQRPDATCEGKTG